jgi:hexosaminidase
MIALVPRPVSLVEKTGTFRIPSGSIAQAGSTDDTIDVRIDPAGLPPEGYRLSATPAGITIVAGGDAGAFHARTTLRQLVPPEALAPAPRGRGAGGGAARTWPVPCVEIVDRPRFSWRGLMLDTCRHFFPVAFVKKYIDALAFHKMNVFHWHLTEDQGWRIEIRRHPELTDVGAWRTGTLVGRLEGEGPWEFDGVRHGGFYTQDEVRDVVAYAAERQVTVVPEIEMPGHAQAALAAHPELSCTGGPFEVSRTWGIHEEVFCAGNEAVFSLLEDVIGEVAPLFPGPFFHIGGDECPKMRWKACPKCQARMRAEGLADEDALQSWFVRRIERVVNAAGKRLIGWDEILEGGLAPNATVMSWRGVDGGIEAARQGHDVVMSPTTHCYLDYQQAEDPAGEPIAFRAYLPLEKVYSYEPLPLELTQEQGRHVLGVQGNLWTEYVVTPEQAEYMVWPRACALAEAGWSPAGPRDRGNFEVRLAAHLPRLDALGVRYRALDR